MMRVLTVRGFGATLLAIGLLCPPSSDAKVAENAVRTIKAPKRVSIKAGAVSVSRAPTAAPIGRTQAPTVCRGKMTSAKARRLLAQPSGSLSYGKTSRGRLVRGSRIALSGNGYRFFPHIRERGTHYGTDEMKAWLPRLGQRVKQRVRNSPDLAIGNVSLRHGGRSQWHVSHQAGRDVDLCMYAIDKETKKPAVLDNFVKFNWRGGSWDGKLKFDARRNMELVRAMVEDEQVSVQWVFVARWLKRRILAAARANTVPAPIIARMAEVMRQPSDSAPHNDHFHVRIYCSHQDRKYGCVMREPHREWADLGEETFQEHVQALTRVLDLSNARLRRRAVSMLGMIRAASAVGPLAERLIDPDTAVRKAAMNALLNIAAPESGAPILAQLEHIKSAAWAVSVFNLYRTVRPPDLTRVAHVVVKAPGTLLHDSVRATALPRFHVVAAEIFEEHGRQHAVPTLIGLLRSKTPAVRKAAHKALLYVTNQRTAPRNARSRWAKFYKINKGGTWLSWMRRGFSTWGVRLKAGRLGDADVPKLIRALRHRSKVVRRNAERVLTALTGHEISDGYRRKLRNQRNVARHWRYWWKRHLRRLRRQRKG